jgi:dimethylargininase
MLVALTRKVSPGIGRCELTHLERVAIDAQAAGRQHRSYEKCLEVLGCLVESLPTEPDLPDSVFVEDTAIVMDELAVIARPGAPSRRAETATVAPALERYRKLAWIEAPGTLDGGDVLVVGRSVYVGRSPRTNESGFEQLRDLLAPLGYELTPIPVRSCLHLKSAATRVGRDHLLVNPSWVDERVFHGLRLTHVDPAEPFAANALLIGDVVVLPAAHARTQERLGAAGVAITPIDVSELAKAEGGVTCCSLVFEAHPAAPPAPAS